MARRRLVLAALLFGATAPAFALTGPGSDPTVGDNGQLMVATGPDGWRAALVAGEARIEGGADSVFLKAEDGEWVNILNWRTALPAGWRVGAKAEADGVYRIVPDAGVSAEGPQSHFAVADPRAPGGQVRVACPPAAGGEVDDCLVISPLSLATGVVDVWSVHKARSGDLLSVRAAALKAGDRLYK